MDEPIFSMTLLNGYFFRNTLNIIKNETDKLTFCLRPDGVEISFKNDVTGHKIQIHASALQKYLYNVRDDNGKLSSYYYVTVYTQDIVDRTKSIGKKDKVILSITSERKTLDVHPVKSENGIQSNSYGVVSIIEYEPISCTFPDEVYANAKRAKIIAKELADLCSRLTSQKSKHLGVLLHNDTHCILQCLNAQGDQVVVNQISLKDNVEDENAVETNIQYKIPTERAKALSKIHNTSPNPSLVEFFFLENHPLKLVSKIGDFGTHTFYFKDKST